MNKKYKWVSGLIFLGVFVGLFISQIRPSPKNKQELSPLAKVTGYILSTESLLLSGRHGMQCSARGQSIYDGLRKVILSFKIPRKLTKDEGRAFLIDCVHQVIQNVNANEEARPFFLEDGFNEKNVEISIHCTDKEGVFYPDISAFIHSEGKLKYCTDDPKNPRGPYFSRERETYEEAISILKEQGRNEVLLESQLERAEEWYGEL